MKATNDKSAMSNLPRNNFSFGSLKEISEGACYVGPTLADEEAYLDINVRFNEEVLLMRDALEASRADAPDHRIKLGKANLASYAQNLPVIIKNRKNGMFLVNNGKLDPQQISVHRFLEKNFDTENTIMMHRNQISNLAPRRRRRGTAKILKAIKR